METSGSESSWSKTVATTSSEDEKGDKETWVEWLQRTTRVAEAIMVQAKIPDWAEEQRRRKWRWAGHVSRREDKRWSTRLLDWVPEKGSRRWGQPNTRWADSLEQFAKSKGFVWQEMAKDRKKWEALETEYAKSGKEIEPTG